MTRRFIAQCNAGLNEACSNASGACWSNRLRNSTAWIGNGKVPMPPWPSAFWGDHVGPNPTDRGKPGTKRSVLTEADGGPLAVVVAAPTWTIRCCCRIRSKRWWLSRPIRTQGSWSNIYAWTKATAGPPCDATSKVFGYVPHVADRRGKVGRTWPASVIRPVMGLERTHGWPSKCRAILVRYAKKSSNYLGQIKLGVPAAMVPTPLPHQTQLR